MTFKTNLFDKYLFKDIDYIEEHYPLFYTTLLCFLYLIIYFYIYIFISLIYFDIWFF